MIILGAALIVFLVPFVMYINKKTIIEQNVQMKEKDRRIKQTDEVLNGIKVLKLYAWENSFAKNILDTRKEELRSLRMLGVYNSSISFF